ncbi:membrane protein insertion efficiency factor YidD [Muricauda ruestringensis]|uniref:membrane protein insertion efficiency factor YidD n=1 Tax=Flagellimonas ruestringensis TaxID=111501 RepID=UPI001CD57939|nr:membrane protein insertion efficiency factor YidD [Allomuricauda ruestringensis]MCA0958298.1 membrane protein insertion efficiency factor YidD [Allomuricauda ruestringensis]
MKYLLLTIISGYWLFIPKSKRKKCIFQVSCSQYVYKITSNKGFVQGLRALRFRYRNCRYGYENFKNPVTQETQLMLPNGEVIGDNEISTRVVNQYKKELLTIVNHYEKQ